MTKAETKFVPKRTVAVAFGSIALSVFALLLWGKLKLVAGVPRTAYAVPEAAAAPKPAHPAPDKQAPEATTSVPAERSGPGGD